MKKPNLKETPAPAVIQAPAPQTAAQVAAPAQEQVQNVNPVDVAKLTLQFLARSTLTPAERGQFAVCEQMMQAIATGAVVLSPVQRGPAAPSASNGHDAAGARTN
jgi:hypothetical protein